jgi:lysophospholipase L1-like esterase
MLASNGYSTNNYLGDWNSYKTILQSNNVDTAMIMIGGADAAPIIDTSIEQYKSNMQYIIEQLKQSGVETIILNEPLYKDPNRVDANNY